MKDNQYIYTNLRIGIETNNHLLGNSDPVIAQQHGLFGEKSVFIRRTPDNPIRANWRSNTEHRLGIREHYPSSICIVHYSMATTGIP